MTVDNYLLDVDRRSSCPSTRRCGCCVTAADVLHAWWVPALGVKKDAVPGFINETWFTADTEGTYRGQCAELCGMDHGFMPIVVRVVSHEEYDAWLGTQRARVSALHDRRQARTHALSKEESDEQHRDRHARARITASHSQGLAWLMRWVTTTNHKDIGTLYLCVQLSCCSSAAEWR